MALVLWKQNQPFDTLYLPTGFFFRQNGAYFDRNLQAISYDPTTVLPSSTPTVKVGDVYVGAPGSAPSVVNRGTQQNAILDFTIPKVGKSDFWGINGHLTWTWTPNATGYLKANWAFACLRLLELGCKTYRNGYGWTEDGTTGAITGSDGNTFVDFITNFAQPCGIKVHPVLLMTYTHPIITDETSAYNFGYARGVEAATKLKGLVPWYEIGNEIETYALTGRGQWYGDYDMTKFRKLRGLLRGTVAGIKSVDTVTPIMSPGGTWMHTAFYDNLLHGIEPDGSTGHPTLDWDLTSWHWYVKNYPGNDDIEVLSAQGGYNVLATIAAWGKPIYITECGAQASSYSGSDSALSAAIMASNVLIDRFWAVRNTYNIKHVSLYQLFDAASAGTAGTADEMNYGFMASDGSTKKGRYTDLMNYVSLHQTA